jgi:competence protein ComEC
MPTAVLALALGYVSQWLAKVPVLLTTVALDGITGTIRGLGGMHLADLRVAMPSDVMIMLAAASLLLAMWAARRRIFLTSAGLLAIFLMSLALALVAPHPSTHRGVLEFTSIDVGEGDSGLVITPAGKTLLVDAGGPIGPGGSQLDFGEDVVSPYLWTICGPGASLASTPSQLRTDTPITSAAWLRSCEISARRNCGSACCHQVMRWKISFRLRRSSE